MIRSAPVLFISDAYFIFGGGSNSEPISIIARLDVNTYKWSHVGELQTKRGDHNVIQLGGRISELSFLVVGGHKDVFPTEKCVFSDGRMYCTEQEPILSGYWHWPELIPVPGHFC